ncbi:MAG: cysteine desulfurase family protein [Deltaproteobacteria bacterium]
MPHAAAFLPQPAALSRPMPVYLDNHATTRVDPRVVAEMLPFFDEQFGNAASINHRYGWEAAEAVETARQQIARFLNASPDAIVFTSGGTESNNLAIKGVMRAAPPGGHLIVSAAEHRSVLDPAKRLARQGYELTIVPVDQTGRVEPQAVADALQPQTVLASVMLANNEVGTINPVREIAEICRGRNVLLHCDAVQAVGRIPVDLQALSADLVSFSAHKLYGPKGIGALYVRPGEPRIRMEPLFDGGGHERRMRSGTLPVPLIAGFGTACRLAADGLPQEAVRLKALRDRLWEGLSQRLEGLFVNGHPVERLPGNLNVSFDGVDGQVLMTSLTEIAVSSGSACTSADPEPSHVLRAMGVSEARSKASLRFGLGRFTTGEEIDFAIDYVATTITRLRSARAQSTPPLGKRG